MVHETHSYIYFFYPCILCLVLYSLESTILRLDPGFPWTHYSPISIIIFNPLFSDIHYYLEPTTVIIINPLFSDIHDWNKHSFLQYAFLLVFSDTNYSLNPTILRYSLHMFHGMIFYFGSSVLSSIHWLSVMIVWYSIFSDPIWMKSLGSE